MLICKVGKLNLVMATKDYILSSLDYCSGTEKPSLKEICLRTGIICSLVQHNRVIALIHQLKFNDTMSALTGIFSGFSSVDESHDFGCLRAKHDTER